MSQTAKRKKKAKSKKVSYKDKVWYEVIAPKTFNFRNIGEIIGLEENILNRTLRSYYIISLKITMILI